MDGFPSIFKMCARELVPLLCTTFFRLRLSAIPTLWKPRNFLFLDELILLTLSSIIQFTSPAVSEVLETISDRLGSSTERERQVRDIEYGFRCRRSTGDLLIFVIHPSSNSLDNYGQAYLVSLDTPKAFNPLWHDVFLVKLPTFEPPLASGMSSFLSKQIIIVQVDGVLSVPSPVNPGVPLDSVLTSILFLLFIIDFLFTSSNPVHSFADDATLLLHFLPSNFYHCVANGSLNFDLEGVCSWGSNSYVTFNAS